MEICILEVYRYYITSMRAKKEKVIFLCVELKVLTSILYFCRHIFKKDKNILILEKKEKCIYTIDF